MTDTTDRPTITRDQLDEVIAGTPKEYRMGVVAGLALVDAKVTNDVRHIARIESVLDNLHCGLPGDQTEKLARQMYERGVRFNG